MTAAFEEAKKSGFGNKLHSNMTGGNLETVNEGTTSTITNKAVINKNTTATTATTVTTNTTSVSAITNKPKAANIATTLNAFENLGGPIKPRGKDENHQAVKAFKAKPMPNFKSLHNHLPVLPRTTLALHTPNNNNILSRQPNSGSAAMKPLSASIAQTSHNKENVCVPQPLASSEKSKFGTKGKKISHRHIFYLFIYTST